MNKTEVEVTVMPFDEVLRILGSLLKDGKISSVDQVEIRNIVKRSLTGDVNTAEMDEKGKDIPVRLKHFLEAIEVGGEYGVFGLNAKGTGFNTQFTNFKVEEDEFRFLDDLEGIPKEFLDDDTKVFIRFKNRGKKGNVISFRVADRRIDNREGVHTTVFIKLPSSVTKSRIESVGRDVESVRKIFTRVLEKSNSRFRGAESKVRTAILI